MNATPPTNSPIIAAFIAHTPCRAAAYVEAREHFPGGVTHGQRCVRAQATANAATLRDLRAEGEIA